MEEGVQPMPESNQRGQRARPTAESTHDQVVNRAAGETQQRDSSEERNGLWDHRQGKPDQPQGEEDQPQHQEHDPGPGGQGR